MLLELSDLPYAHDALSPYMSAETLELHHDKHHLAYVTNGNALIEANGVAGISIENITPIGNGILTVSSLDQAIKRSDPLQLDKGADAAMACISLINIKNNINYG